ncbi:winged helix-turn-helix transcriptional regulator [Candidatus Bathyarchaeota archaeon]|nr:winged helix-turn-helix transcriptional regulator [Candidatus Bathyarchaeota archaeon]RLG92462.1 MAG: Lrp/AsnC family transcriptional regulator [Candidatus Bathyarchaeota archaeon]
MKIDDVDRKIISELLKDGRSSYVDLGKAIGYTIMGAKRRVQKMLSSGLIRVSADINVDKLGLHAALILLEFESREALNRCLEKFKDCPRIVNMFTLFAGYNLAALVIAEDKDTLESESMEKCSLRCSEGVRRTEFYPIGTIFFSPYLKVRMNLVTKDKKITPCRVKCDTCERYKADKCVGCPATIYYKGPL